MIIGIRGTHFLLLFLFPFNNVFWISNGPKKTSKYVQSIVNTACLLSFVFTDKYWRNSHNRRKFFIEFASQKGFDPLVAANWENVQRMEMVKQVIREKSTCKRSGREREIDTQNLNKVGYGPLNYYKNNLRKAITDSFPKIGAHISPLLLFFSFNNIFCSSITPKKPYKYVQSLVNTTCLFIFFIHRQVLE